MPVSINGNTGVVTGLAALPDSAMASGSIIQVERNATISTFSTNSTSYSDIPNCTLNFTPSSASNKYLATFSAYISTNLASSHNQQTKIKMFIDSTQIGGTQVYAAESASGGLQWKGSSYLRAFESFSGTSQVTFKVQGAANNTNSTVYVYNPTIIVMEIAA